MHHWLHFHFIQLFFSYTNICALFYSTIQTLYSSRSRRKSFKTKYRTQIILTCKIHSCLPSVQKTFIILRSGERKLIQILHHRLIRYERKISKKQNTHWIQCHRSLLRLNICNSRLSFLNKTLYFLRYWLQVSGICPINPTKQKINKLDH